MDVTKFIANCKKVEQETEELNIPSGFHSQNEMIVETETEEDFESFNIDYDFETYHHEEISFSSSDITVVDMISDDSLKIQNLIEYDVDLLSEWSESPCKTPRKFICEYCGNTYRRKDSLKQHLLTHRVYPNKKEKRQIYTCPHCNAEFYYFSTYKIHITNVHSEDRPFKCESCEKSYKRRDSLNKHKLMHDNDRKFLTGC